LLHHQQIIKHYIHELTPAAELLVRDILVFGNNSCLDKERVLLGLEVLLYFFGDVCCIAVESSLVELVEERAGNITSSGRSGKWRED